MAILNEDIKNNIRLVWFAVLQALYSFPPIQRVLLVAGVLLIIPGYWGTRVIAKTYYNWTYSKQLLVAHSSFTNPQAVIIGETKIFPLQRKQFVAYAKISNPNLDLAGFDVPYTLAVKNSQGADLYTTTGHTYVLPGGDQYITSPSFSSPEQPQSVSVVFGNVHWQKRFSIPTVKMTTPVVTFADSSNGLLLGGAVINNSAYTLGVVRMTFLIYNSQGSLVGVTQRDEFDVAPQSRRAFPQTWPADIFADNVSKVTPIASTNSLDIRNLKSPSSSSGN